MRRVLIAATVAALAAAAVAGSAVAVAGSRSVAPAADGKIYGCYTSSGKLRVVAKSKRCKKGEHRLVWNQTGARGPAGKPPPAEPTHEVGAPGEPPYAAFFGAYPSTTFAPLAFTRDLSGIVHLSGLACRVSLGTTVCVDSLVIAGSQSIFTLPPGFRPSRQHVFAATSFGLMNYHTARIDVAADGSVILVTPPSAGGAWISFDGIEFRAEQ